MHPLSKFLLSTFLPATCLSCREDLPSDQFFEIAICSVCWLRIKWRKEKLDISHASLDDVYAVADYDGPLRDLLHAFKYKGREEVGRVLSVRWMRETFMDWDDIDMIVAVPTYYWKKLKRGYNPAVVVATELAKLSRKRVVSGLLKRKWVSSSQTKLNRRSRAKNARRSFTLTPKAASLKGQRILLVDDVFTTGATLDACARLLKDLGAASVKGGVLAYEPLFLTN